MPHQDLVKKWEDSRGINTHIERKSFLYGKTLSNNIFLPLDCSQYMFQQKKIR